MNAFWWQLPGPARFVAGIAQDLRQGKNVIVCMPEYTPAYLDQAVHSVVRDGERQSWRQISVSGPLQTRPVDFLFAAFGCSAPAAALRNASAVANEPILAGSVILLSDISSSAWPVWRSFLVEYAHVCRARPEYQRAVFLVPLVGQLALQAPQEDICLASHFWRGAVDQLDMLLFTARICPERRQPILQRRLAIGVVAHLALWDPAVSYRLIHEDLRYILNPTGPLRELAAERGWRRGKSMRLSWEMGSVDIMEGQKRSHSAVLALADDKNELESRIWSAQVGVVFPFVEEKRRELINMLMTSLEVPFTTQYGTVIVDRHDLELGHIESQIIAKRLPVPQGTMHLIQRLRKIRNALSHFEVVTPELLLF